MALSVCFKDHFKSSIALSHCFGNAYHYMWDVQAVIQNLSVLSKNRKRAMLLILVS